VIARSDRFERGDYVETVKELNCSLIVKAVKQRKWRIPDRKESSYLWDCLIELVPAIAYYPTFIFAFPERIYLTPRPGAQEPFYTSVFEDILAADGQGYSVADITRRVRTEKFKTPWPNFFQAWMQGDDRKKVQQIIYRASATVTRMVFGKWNQIFHEDARGKEVVIEYGVDEGRVVNKETKTYVASDDHDIYIWFEIKDGARRFKVNDRSLGFRWFFAFLLFTQFRVSRESNRPVLFLFDEPAANLHAAAQQKLIESFPEIATNGNMLLYSTHSHYMIDPSWLEQTFIVTNRADAPGQSIVDSAVMDDESLDISAHRYRKFVNEHPNETSYFQPILDRLEVVPSKFDHNIPSIVLEGKSDYYILSYAAKLLRMDGVRLLPASGSGTFSSLISLSVGWGIKFLFLLDSDGAGEKEKARYALELGAPRVAITCLGDHLQAREIEDLLDKEAIETVRAVLEIANRPTKKQISRFFQESLAKDQVIDLGKSFRHDADKLLKSLVDSLNSL
jgi:hypothetical protein